MNWDEGLLGEPESEKRCVPSPETRYGTSYLQALARLLQAVSFESVGG